MARPREFDEAEVIDAAERVFWQRGYDDTSVNDLLDAAGIGRASLYSTFGGKDQLLLRVLARHRQRLDGMLKHLLEPPSGLTGILAFFHMAVDMATQSEGKGCLIAQTAGSAAAHGRPVAQELASILEGRRKALRHALAVARQKGELRDGDLDDLVSFLLTLATGISGAARAGVGRKELMHAIDVGVAGLATTHKSGT
ncbi:MAG: TetR/AcrR family transcriptional regulator [Deltaproteobacteria bacterium]|nr:TetR/AcrR family transcriptional regulator [Deltaproteobacteria bacterium]